jgi:hypothetical protein
VGELAGEAVVLQRPVEKLSLDELFGVDIVGLYLRVTPPHEEGRILEDAGEFPSESITTTVGVFTPVGDGK